MPKINSGRKLVNLLRKSGTGQSKLDVAEAKFPTDRKTGEVKGDIPAQVVVDALEESYDAWLENGELGLPPVQLATLEKARAFHARGEWEPPSRYRDPETLPVEFEDGESEDVVPVKKNKGGRPKKVVEAAE